MVAILATLRRAVASALLLVAEWGAAATFVLCLALGVVRDGSWFAPAIIVLVGGLFARDLSRLRSLRRSRNRMHAGGSER